MGLELTVEYFVCWIMFLFPEVGEESNYCILPNITLCRLSQVRNQLGWAEDGQRTFPVSAIDPLSVRYEHCYQPDIYTMYVSCLCSHGSHGKRNSGWQIFRCLKLGGWPSHWGGPEVWNVHRRWSIEVFGVFLLLLELIYRRRRMDLTLAHIPAVPAVPCCLLLWTYAGNKSGTIVETTWFVWFRLVHW